ncbi:unnamed protein product [Trifolium pratense]|uniref:Uncharacterized protein n=1 Tax=Trifolium pratense TaxID=57577 RepID=A0ACB0L2G2_TRIPR|nr:unnamed protein product [Trifolium pratense]
MGETGKTTIAKAIDNKICRTFEEIGINVLVERSLVTVDDKNKLGMHDLLRDMGREIIREKSPKEPEERSRLWFYQDVFGVLFEQTGTKEVEGLALKVPTANLKCFSTKAFKKMKRLRLLQLAVIPLDVPHSNSHELSSISNYLPSLWVECSSELQLSHDATIILDALYATYSEESEPIATTSQNLTIDESGGCVLPIDSYPNWLSFDCEGSSVIFEVPQVEGHNLKSLMCITCSSTPDNITSDSLKNVLVKNYTKATIQLYKKETLASFEDEEGQRVVSSIEPGNKVEIIVVFGNGFVVK